MLSHELKVELANHLAPVLSTAKSQLIERVLSQRTRYVTLVLEDIYQPQNASALLRTSECFGLQDMHIIERQHQFSATRGITKGASDWMTLSVYRAHQGHTTRSCFARLRQKGYRIAATSLRPDAIPIDQLPVDTRIALALGTEQQGLSNDAHDDADLHVTFPMFGFTQSFNVAVSAALCLQVILDKVRRSEHQWQLTPDEKLDLRIQWIRNTLSDANGDMLVANFLRAHGLPLDTPIY